MRFFIIFAILGSAIPGLGQACNPNLAPALSVRDKEFQDATKLFMESEGNKYARLSAYDTMLRIDGSAFGVVLRDGYLSEDDSLIAAAVTCETLRSNGGVATVTGLPDNADGLSDPQKKQILGYGFNLKKIPGSVDWERACFSTYKHKEEGCHPSRFVSVRDGVISFRHDNSTGSFRRVDGEFIGTIELFYGGPILTVPAKLTLQ